MAISDIKGTVTTTGMMGKGPEMPVGKVDPKLPQVKTPKPEVAKQVNTQNQGSSLKEQFPDASETEITLAERFKTLTAEDRASISAVLSPSVTAALSKMLPEFAPLMEQIGSTEPNLVMPMSVAANYAIRKYGIEDPKQAVTVLAEDIFGNTQMETQQTNVPPGNQEINTTGLMKADNTVTQPSNMDGMMTSPQNMETV